MERVGHLAIVVLTIAANDLTGMVILYAAFIVVYYVGPC